MNIFSFIFTISLILGLLSIVYKKAFFLSILVSLEIILLNIIMFNFFTILSNGNPTPLTLSLFILALAAVEASIGVSIITLISRNFSNNSISSLNILKN
uniref:NADH-ubiquinone oxidoreductase chain 4L n=1 Tax=Amphipholis squamata TaxID=48271 RepID=D3H5V3_AMPSQ|nr:NADH dehydrogenase subunit 4L [Amphipholis squamata]